MTGFVKDIIALWWVIMYFANVRNRQGSRLHSMERTGPARQPWRMPTTCRRLGKEWHTAF